MDHTVIGSSPTPSPTPTLSPSAGAAGRRAWVEQIMGMPISIHLRGSGLRRPADGENGVAAAIADTFAVLREVEDRFSTYSPDSEISRMARGELTARDAHPQVRDVIRLCEQARERTEGWFDARRPDGTGGSTFDPTGLVKGWAVQRACSALASRLPEHDVLVNAGGDIAVWCAREDGEPWHLAIENPLDRTALLARLDLRTGGLATSGTAARGAHIYSPATGSAATELASVSVIGPSLMWADVYATAAFARGPAAVGWLRTLEHHAWLVVDLDGTTTSSGG
ncbi:MAG: FAD:protein FMN transferase [Kineosporiaceae bacterium]|nr:FAD:protein FMN transferase [Kineosporiaceae bacterium]